MKKMYLLIPTAICMMSCSVLASADTIAEPMTEVMTEISTEAEEELDPVSQIYTFTLNGDTYTLPCTVAELTENGWNLGSGSLDANTYARAMGCYEDGTETVIFEVANVTEEDGVDLSELVVVGVKVEQKFLEVEGYEFETFDGVKPGMKVDEVRELYGEPSFEHETYWKYCFQDRYTPDSGELRGFGLAYLGEDGFTVNMEEGSDVINRVELQYFGMEKEAEE